MKSKVQQPVNTRNVILDVAERALIRVGYQGVSLQAIAREIGLSKPAIYHHFPAGKAELFIAILHRTLEQARVGLQDAIEQAGGTGRERMAATVGWLMAEPERGRGLDRMHDVARFVDPALQGEMAERYRLAHHEPIRAFVAEAIEVGQFRAGDADFIAWSVLSLVAGMLEAGMMPDGTTRADADDSVMWVGITDQITDLIMNGVTDD